jgi:predicted site-specific integrase-resolvase
MQPISIKQAQSLLGGVSRQTIYSWVNRGLIHLHHVPGTRRSFLDYKECQEIFKKSEQSATTTTV